MAATSPSLPADIDKGLAHKTIKENSVKFKESGIKPRKLASCLYKNDLISVEVYRKVVDSASTCSDEDKLEIILEEIQNNSLVKNGYFEKVVQCLKDLNDSTIAGEFISTYNQMLATRENVLEGLKERAFDTFLYLRRKMTQAGEGIKTFGYEIAKPIAKDVVKDTGELENDLDDPPEEKEDSDNAEEESEVEPALCLKCEESITLEEEPVHEKCLAEFPWCLRCFQNHRSGASTQCAQCLKYEQVSICYSCLEKTQNSSVHLSCFEHFPWCARCLKHKRERSIALCAKCGKSDQDIPWPSKSEKVTVHTTEHVCLVCGEANNEDTPVHKKCSPLFPWCMKCQANVKFASSEFCETCLSTTVCGEESTEIVREAIRLHVVNEALQIATVSTENASNDLDSLVTSNAPRAPNPITNDFSASTVPDGFSYSHHWSEFHADSQLLGINDLDEVLSALEDGHFETPQWKRLGLKLGVCVDTLEVIEANNPRDVKQCLMECIAKWLRRVDEVDRRGRTTWRTLTHVLTEIGQRQTAGFCIRVNRQRM